MSGDRTQLIERLRAEADYIERTTEVGGWEEGAAMMREAADVLAAADQESARLKAEATKICLLAEGLVHDDNVSSGMVSVAVQRFITNEEITLDNERALVAEAERDRLAAELAEARAALQAIVDLDPHGKYRHPKEIAREALAAVSGRQQG